MPSGTTTSPGGRIRALAPGLLAAALAVALYARTVGFQYASDDVFVLRSPLLREPWNLRELFSGGFYARPDRTLGLYRPVGQASLVWNAILAHAATGRYDAWGWFHAVNVLLHAGASFLLFVWLSKLPLPRFAAGAAAVLWALHPVHAEVAANVTARYESLALGFGLAFLIAERAGGIARAVLGPLLLFLALGCKESAIAFLPLAAGVELLFPTGGRRGSARRWIAPCAVAAAWLVLRHLAIAGEETSLPYVENPAAPLSAAVRVLTAAKVQLLYLRDQVLPLWLATDHSYAELRPVRTALDPCVLGFAALAAASLCLAWRLRSSWPGIPLCVAGWALLFLPASNFVLPIGTIMADRLAYAPSVFSCLLAAILLAHLRPRGAAIAAVALAGALLGFQSWRRSEPWRDDRAFATDQVATAPRSAKSHGNLGWVLLKEGRLQESVAEYRKSLEIYPYRPEPYIGLGQAYEGLGSDPDLLIDTWADSIRFGTRGERPLLQEALVATDLGDWPGLLEVRGRMVAADPEDRFLVRVDRLLHAAQDLFEIPRSGEDWLRAGVLFRLRDWAQAEEKYRRVLHHRDLPGNEIAPTLENLAVCEENLGRPQRAEHFRRLAAAWAAKPR
jgi:tetratricopeptide (TPR) repeat protein